MTFCQRFQGFIRHLLVLTMACLILEQCLYCVVESGYVFRMLASPVFWGLESILCFVGLWRMNRTYPNDYPSSELPDELEELFEEMERDFRWYPAFDPDTQTPL